MTFLRVGPFENGMAAVAPIPIKCQYSRSPRLRHANQSKGSPEAQTWSPRYRDRDKAPGPELGGRGSAGRAGFPNEGLLRARGKPAGATCREGLTLKEAFLPCPRRVLGGPNVARKERLPTNPWSGSTVRVLGAPSETLQGPRRLFSLGDTRRPRLDAGSRGRGAVWAEHLL